MMMEERLQEISCPDCGAKLNQVAEGSSMTISCPACGWSVATTWISPVWGDSETYEVYLSNSKRLSLEQLKTVSHILGVNYLETLKRIEHAELCIFIGKAPAVFAVKEALEDAGISFYIMPDFPY